MRILVVEDSPPTRELLRNSLERAGHVVTSAARVTTGLKSACAETFDVIVLDVMLPDGSGLDLCREIRQLGIATPILFLTARGEVGDRITGLDSGGDDYLKKPFALAELHARLRALGRRQGLVPSARVARGETQIDFTARRLERGGQEIPLTAREWQVLEMLCARAGRVVQREDLLASIWGRVDESSAESLEVIVSRIRHKLDPDGEGGWIRTIRGQGYSFETQR